MSVASGAIWRLKQLESNNRNGGSSLVSNLSLQTPSRPLGGGDLESGGSRLGVAYGAPVAYSNFEVLIMNCSLMKKQINIYSAVPSGD